MVRAGGRDLVDYCERHHIVPRALGGANDKSNIVRLTYREHFLAHWLLTKFPFVGDQKRKMQFALWSMTRKANGMRIVSGWQYSVARSAKIVATVGVSRPDMSLKLRGNKNGLGYKHTPAALLKIRAASIARNAVPPSPRGRAWSEASRDKAGQSKLGNKNALGHRHSLEAKELQRQKAVSRELRKRQNGIKCGGRPRKVLSPVRRPPGLNNKEVVEKSRGINSGVTVG